MLITIRGEEAQEKNKMKGILLSSSLIALGMKIILNNS
jgi:hypothetical protein